MLLTLKRNSSWIATRFQRGRTTSCPHAFAVALAFVHSLLGCSAEVIFSYESFSREAAIQIEK